MTYFTNLVSLVSLLAMGGVSILVGENCNSFGTQLEGSAKGANGDFTAVCNQNLAKHLFLT